MVETAVTLNDSLFKGRQIKVCFAAILQQTVPRVKVKLRYKQAE